MISADSLIGKQIDQFKLDQFIAKGAMGMVYKASDTFLNRTVAIKLIPKNVEVGPGMEEARKRLLQEARAASRLTHPNIVTIHSYGETDDFQYICMEYVVGKTLAQILNEQKVLAIEDVLDLFAQILLALEAANRELIVHRDIKPTNIMVMEDKRVKVMDFGVAKIPSLSITTTGTVLGTPFYMSPEQISGQKVDIRSDIFSVGVILYQALTGERPFEGESTVTLAYKIVQVDPVPPKVLNVHIPQFIENICKKALAKDPALRYQTPAEMLRDIKAARKKGFSEETNGTTVKSKMQAAATVQVKKADLALERPQPIPPASEKAAPGKPPAPPEKPGPKPEPVREPEPVVEETKPETQPTPPSPKVQPTPKAKQPSPKAQTPAASHKPVAVIAILLVIVIFGVVMYALKAKKPAQSTVPPTGVTPPAATTAPPAVTSVAPPAAQSVVPPSPAEPTKAAVDALISDAKNQWNSNPAAAQSLLERAVALDPNNFEAAYQLGRLLTFRKDFTNAIAQYNNALRINSNSPDIFFNLGYIYLTQGNYDQAIKNYESCWALSPHYKDEVLTNLGICHLKKNNVSQARLLFQQALDLNPNNDLARTYLKSTGG
jgi:serine/threonine protein kinase/cytochrome c-type biogenesis protein CcmH/NrfG